MSYAFLIFFLPKIVTGIHFASKFTSLADTDLFYINPNSDLYHESHIAQRIQFIIVRTTPPMKKWGMREILLRISI